MNALLQIWAYCCTCWDRTHQVYVRDEGIYEVYLCENCKHEHKVAVR
jgi:hypothetical protein